MLTIVVSGALANKCHNGGEAWVRLSWVLGFRKLGCRVYFVEQIEPADCVDATGRVAGFPDSVNLAYFREVSDRFALSGSAALVYAGGRETYGLAWRELLDVVEGADLLVNISGHLRSEEIMRRLRRKAYIDIDPGFTQYWHAAGNPGARLAGHDCYFTIGENIGTASCPIPTSGVAWRRTRQPVVLDEWPVTAQETPGRFTTVASWRGAFGPVQHAGRTFGLKAHEFRKFLELPRLVLQPLEIALDIHPADERDRRALSDNGWQLNDPKREAPDPWSFRRYVQDSGAEFSVAQGIYLETQSGWFSDRTTRYLASGKPALVQDTGFSRHYPVGRGLLAFRTLGEAVAGVKQIREDYPGHCRAARDLAEEYFDSDKVLGRFLAEAGVS